MAAASIAVDAGEIVHVVAQLWTEGVQTSPAVTFRKPAGGTWSGPVVVQDPGGRQWRDTAMFTDSAGGVHAAWKDGNRPGKYRSVASGGDLGAAATVDIPVPPDPSIHSVSMGDLFVTANGDVHHTFLTYPLLQIWYEVRRGDTGAFGEPSLAGPLNNDESQGYENPWPALAVDSFGRVLTSWAENRGGATIPFVVLATFDGTTWTREDLTTTADINRDSGPAMTAVGDLVYVVYRDQGGDLTLVTLRHGPL